MTKKNQTAVRSFIFLLLVSCVSPNLAIANTTFSDSTFNLSDYSISKYQTGVDDVAVVSQILTGGNPAATIQSVINIPPTGGSTFHATQFLSNSTFHYDPSLQGAISSIDASTDLYASFTAGGVPAPFSEAGVFSVIQGGNIYVHSQQVSPVVANFTPVHAFGLKAADFTLVTDRNNIFAVDPTQHPNFSSGILEFGVVGLAYIPAGYPATTAVNRFDNLNFNITAVPEPEAYAMLLAGLGLLSFMSHRRKTA